jgi:hypothetical protein
MFRMPRACRYAESGGDTPLTAAGYRRVGRELRLTVRRGPVAVASVPDAAGVPLCGVGRMFRMPRACHRAESGADTPLRASGYRRVGHDLRLTVRGTARRGARPPTARS